MADISGSQAFFESVVDTIGKESDAFAKVLDAMMNLDVTKVCGGAAETFSAVGSALLTLFFCMEAFTYCASIDFNGGIEGALKVAMKLVVSQLIIQNVGNITEGVIDLFKNKTEIKYSTVFSDITASFTTTAELDDGGILDINYLCMGILLLLVLIVLFVLLSLIVVQMMGVIFETGMLIAIAPVALSTLVNTQARSTGIAFIKNLAAVSMQWGILAVCFTVYSNVGSALVLNISASGSTMLSSILTFTTPLLSVIILTIMVKKSSEITKRALGG